MNTGLKDAKQIISGLDDLVQNKNEKIPLVLFTGGLDSTYLLYDRLTNHTDVDIFYCNWDSLYNKKHAETKAQASIIEYIKAISSFSIQNKYKFDLDSKFPFQNFQYNQPLAFITSALSIVDLNRHSCVEMGYIREDDIVHDLPHLLSAWNSLSLLLKGEVVPLKFPLIRECKTDIYKHLPKKLRKLTFSCEIPNEKKIGRNKFIYEPCGDCPACIRRKVVEYKVKLLKSKQNKFIIT